jgi:YD repeat-containing protein
MSASYEYNELGEILAVVDSKGNRTVSTYDLSGARTSLSSPDAGKVILKYDEAGNLAEKTDEVLRRSGESVRYEYDGLERLVRVNYPRTAPTVYVYGGETAPAGGIGRLLRRDDSSGWAIYEYGLLGETVATTRTIDRLTPLAPNESARFEYRSDYLGRMQRISYPDGEILSYGSMGRTGQVVRSSHRGLETDTSPTSPTRVRAEDLHRGRNGTRTSFQTTRTAAGIRHPVDGDRWAQPI